MSAAGHAAEAAREKELARRLSSVYEQWDKRPAAEAVPKGLERVKSDVELPHAQRVDQAVTSTEQRDQQELARFYLDRGRRLFDHENDREALVELNRALFLSPYEPAAHLLVGRIHLRNGRVHEAMDAFKISLWSHESAEAHVALGEAYLQAKDAAAARAEAERALALDPASADAKKLIERAAQKHVTARAAVVQFPRLAHHSQDDGFHEIQLNGKQLVFLFMAATVVSVVIFLCGVLVGRGVRAERPARATGRSHRRRSPSRRPRRPPAAPPPADTGPAERRRLRAPADEVPLTYPDRLEKPKDTERALKKAPRSRAARKAGARAAEAQRRVPQKPAIRNAGASRRPQTAAAEKPASRRPRPR